MVIDTSIVIKDYLGVEMKNAEETGDGKVAVKPLILRDVFISALNNMLPNDLHTAEQKAKIYALSVRIYNHTSVELSPEEIQFLKERVGKIWPAVVFGKTCEILDAPVTSTAN